MARSHDSHGSHIVFISKKLLKKETSGSHDFISGTVNVSREGLETGLGKILLSPLFITLISVLKLKHSRNMDRKVDTRTKYESLEASEGGRDIV